MNQFQNVTIDAIANIYFEGKVVSHTIHFPDGSRKTAGVILPGSYHFGTGAPERMEIIAGACRVRQDADGSESNVIAGESFDVPGKSGFTIEVSGNPCQYICSFLAE